MTRIKRITRIGLTKEKLYNLAVEGDESYIANGVVVHNCRSQLVPITKYKAEELQDGIVSGDLKSQLRKPNEFYDGFKTKPAII